MTDPLIIDYRLPVTVARFKGTRTTLINRLADDSVVREGAAAIVVKADVRGDRCTAMIRDPDLAKVKLSIKRKEDGRLVATESSVEARSSLPAKALITVGAAVGGAALALGAAPITAAVATAAAAGAVGAGVLGSDLFSADRQVLAFGAGSDFRADWDFTRAQGAPEDPTAIELGIHPSFGLDDGGRPADYQRLYNYRLAMLRTTLAHSKAAKEGSFDSLKQLTKTLALVRTEAAHAERVYEEWVKEQITKQVVHYVEEWPVDELPDENDFLVKLDGNTPAKWKALAKNIGVMVTVDILEDLPNAPSAERESDADENGMIEIWYRRPAPALVKTWKVFQDDNEWKATMKSADWMLVTHPYFEEKLVVPVEDVGADETLAAVFAESGAVVELSSTVSGERGERAEFLSSLPAVIKDSATAGVELAGLRTTALQQQIDVLEKRDKLQGLLNPKPDELEDLKAALEEAQLQSQLALASQIAEDPTSVLVVVAD